jgi:hypothetical protein
VSNAAPLIALVLGLIPAAIAKSKGHSFFAFWVFGFLLFIVALPVAIFMKPKVPPSPSPCAACGQPVPPGAAACPQCGHSTVPAVAPGELPQSAEGLREALELRQYQIRRFTFSSRHRVKLPDGSVRDLPDEPAFQEWARAELAGASPGAA